MNPPGCLENACEYILFGANEFKRTVRIEELKETVHEMFGDSAQ
jgi:hypothetical protein